MMRILFDKQDHELLNLVNDVLDKQSSSTYLKTLFDPYLHPNGIKELAAAKDLRIAYAMIHLLDSLEVGMSEERLMALRSVRDEVMHCSSSTLIYNTGRVLLQIMKELVRAKGDYRRQLELAHDFRRATSGNPRIIRSQLRRYDLLEMPESWNQITFDDHVHDANTKGRKSATHLVMDAWIKGIRSLTIIHYNYVKPEAAEELLEAAEIMGIKVRIGVEYSARFRGGRIHLIWIPRYLVDSNDYLNFLAQPDVAGLFVHGKKASDYQQKVIYKALDDFNQRDLPALNEAYGFKLDPISLEGFREYVGKGQASMLHLAMYIHQVMMPEMEKRTRQLRAEYEDAEPERRTEIENTVKSMNELVSDVILENYLPKVGKAQSDYILNSNDGSPPDILNLSPPDLIKSVADLHTAFSITLNLSHLSLVDVLELLYDCQGRISHLEIFNLKDFAGGETEEVLKINELRLALNHGNVLILKRFIREIIDQQAESTDPDAQARLEKLKLILHNVGLFHSYYRKTPLKVRMGSDSTGRADRKPGMGLAIMDTLGRRAQKDLDRTTNPWRRGIPIRIDAFLRTTHVFTANKNPVIAKIAGVMRRIPVIRSLVTTKQEDWVAPKPSTRISDNGNVVSLSAVSNIKDNGLKLSEEEEPIRKPTFSWSYLNSGLKIFLKILIGFIPAFLTFMLTKQWWVLAYLGAFIWFGITGLRNILQSVLGGGGLHRSPVLRWNNYVSWDRLADSLFYTGFSVPLLDYIVKTLFLDGLLNITTATNPLALYTIMALANGVYISGHNIFRGLPKEAIYGNFFRSILSIPLAVAFNGLIGGILVAYGVKGTDVILQKWAAVISKAASDCVAGIIEGTADRRHNMRMRYLDYMGKLNQLFDAISRLALYFPDEDVMEMLESPKEFMAAVSSEARQLEKVVIINALDLLYFWMYQPRARSVLTDLLEDMSELERLLIERTQSVLCRQREISQMFVDGLVGRNFSRPLSFYLDRSDQYLKSMVKAFGSLPVSPGSERDINFSCLMRTDFNQLLDKR